MSSSPTFSITVRRHSTAHSRRVRMEVNDSWSDEQLKEAIRSKLGMAPVAVRPRRHPCVWLGSLLATWRGNLPPSPLSFPCVAGSAGRRLRLVGFACMDMEAPAHMNGGSGFGRGWLCLGVLP
jgi:hypothetical protein